MLPADEMNVARIPVLIGILGFALPVGATDPTNSPPASREYTNRVQFHHVDLDVSKPGSESESGPGLDAGLVRPQGLELDTTQPTEYVPVSRPIPVKKKKDKNWMDVPGTGSSLDKSKEKKESGWGWLADDVSSAEKKREEKARDPADRERDEDETADDDERAEDQEAAEQPEATRANRTQDRYTDKRYEPREAPDLYREGKGGSQAVIRAETAGQPGAFGNPDAPTSLLPGGQAAVNHAPVHDAGAFDPKSFSQDTALGIPSAGDSGVKDISDFSPVLSSPTVVPGESDSYQSMSPSLGGNSSVDSSFSFGWSSTIGSENPARADESESRLNFGAGSSDDRMSVGSGASQGFGDSSEETRKSVLPW